MTEKYIMALDQGTSSSRAILFDHSGRIIQIAQKEFTQIYPKPGWVEHDPDDILQSQLEVLKSCIQIAGIQASQLAAIGITNQRETTVVWDKHTGKPVYNAIVWQDRRTSEYCDELKGSGHLESIREKTGLIVDAYFSATKIRWILDNSEGARDRAARGDLLFGTVDSWLLWNLTGRKVHATDVTNASRTMIFNIRDLKWDEELLDLMDIPATILPEVKSCSEVFGYLKNDLVGSSVPISGIAGDQQAALFGQLCLEEGMAKNTYGTGCFLVLNTGSRIIRSRNNLLSTIAWQIGGKTTYALEGSVFIGGAVIQWLRDGLDLLDTAKESEEVALDAADNGGVYFVPALTGLGAPHWDQFARGAIFGITRGTTKSHIVRAALESICFQVLDVIQAMSKDTGSELRELRVDGGAVNNRLLLQIQSNLLNANVVRPEILETTALGAAYLAGLAVGYWESTKELSKQWKMEAKFIPEMDEISRQALRADWNKAVARSKGWAK